MEKRPPCSCRRAARSLGQPENLHLPWHRVLGAGGRIVFPASTPSCRGQANRLRADGIAVKSGRVARGLIVDLDAL